ncbi:Microcystin-dependent protein [Roseivivax lentus]|uniref:Microcystin-dependent protein n=1 Tax=Roseivivax lentus TaxID=633194 RepID=A0A1N7PRA1_9RHOB|nr:tail fiber protein [Roseivivax lentus]SIT13092.1 Microcystin-dependent protein [Roseivivax lentus]
MSDPFIAEIRIFAGNFAPRNWAFCDGQLLPIANNTALFSLIGTTYGGDGRTTTALPNLQGRAPMHPGRGPGLTPRQLGEVAGVETVTLTEGQIPAHIHEVRVQSGAASTATPGATTAVSRVGFGDSLYRSDAQTDIVDLATESIAVAGSSQPHNNMQPYLSMSFIIALFGLYPSRS